MICAYFNQEASEKISLHSPRFCKKKKVFFLNRENTEAFCVDHNKLWKILKEVGIADNLTCLLRNLYAGQEATVRTRHGTTDWF